eukprot:CAMPEP_0180751562 /NCGR_PEP_ID=MMETSP1038_2-20121128/31693_1 /TAXON_ID=632150 /ORGANISM="Azadinium spinosum, Strain 3D9" /LENGTH=46 /DNA_ID= /DNA_START= /DNA_END= /DNA_ORIENTATION=
MAIHHAKDQQTVLSTTNAHQSIAYLAIDEHQDPNFGFTKELAETPQ